MRRTTTSLATPTPRSAHIFSFVSFHSKSYKHPMWLGVSKRAEQIFRVQQWCNTIEEEEEDGKGFCHLFRLMLVLFFFDICVFW